MRAPILVVGNYCHDTLVCEDGRVSQLLGGSSAYISSVLAARGTPHRVVAKVGADFAYAEDVPAGTLVSRRTPTTAFRTEYREGRRHQRLTAVCEPIVPDDLGAGQVDVALACGVAFEIVPETLRALRARARVLIVDVQGLIRARANEDAQRVVHAPLAETPFWELLPEIDFLKLSRSEAEFVDLERARLHTNLLLTDGGHGCHLLTKDGQNRHVPARAAVEVDPTGAGDCFVAGFASGLWSGQTIEQSVALGNFCGALAVTQLGVPKLAPEAFTGVAAPEVFR